MNDTDDKRPSALVVLDWPNLIGGANNAGCYLNADALFSHLTLTLGPNVDICACIPIPLHRDTKERRRERARLKDIGYRLLVHETIKNEGDIDAVLAMEVTWALATRPNLESVFIGSGDADFIPVMKLAKSLSRDTGKRIMTGLVAFTCSIAQQWYPIVDKIMTIESMTGLTQSLQR